MKVSAIVAAFLLQKLGGVWADEFPPCTPKDLQGAPIKDSFGRTYDLSGLRVTSGDNEWVATDKVAGNVHTYTINVCDRIYSNSEAREKNAGVWQVSNDRAKEAHSLGVPNSDLKLVEDGVLTLSYENGDPCGEGNLRKSSVITFYCDPKKPKNNAPYLARAEKDCTYVFQWETPHACAKGAFKNGGGAGLAFGKVVVILYATRDRVAAPMEIFVVGGLIYIAGGVSYLRFVKGHRGADQIPHYEFWMQVPSRAKELGTACFHNLRRAIERGGANRGVSRLGGAEYRGLATQDDEHDMRGSQESLMSDHSEDDHSLLDA